ncbi:hypothetical protein PROFUN_16401 [Planoprotostelium fungivorum]|uniref:Transmembrane and coiled-coil domain-containing protein 4-like n=1 Tax=Planoprotostelium fungivorum TaxID=1890364 RepID=A0A2P6MR50_9EUKA|nr:hypothetical protein PROFUN_16401 [Planoprotostelium fungivorum]
MNAEMEDHMLTNEEQRTKPHGAPISLTMTVNPIEVKEAPKKEKNKKQKIPSEKVVFPIIQPEDSFIFTPLDTTSSDALRTDIATLIALELRAWREQLLAEISIRSECQTEPEPKLTPSEPIQTPTEAKEVRKSWYDPAHFSVAQAAISGFVSQSVVPLFTPTDAKMTTSEWLKYFNECTKTVLSGNADLLRLPQEERNRIEKILQVEGAPPESYSFKKMIQELNGADPTKQIAQAEPPKSPEERRVETNVLNQLHQSGEDFVSKKSGDDPQLKLVDHTTPPLDYRHHVLVQLLMGQINHSKGYTPFFRAFLRRLAVLLGVESDDVPFLEFQVSVQIRLNDPSRSVDSDTSHRYNYLKKAAEEVEANRTKANQTMRYGKIALATAIGGTLIGVTGGLAAPAVAAVLAGWGLTTVVATKVVITALFAGYGAKSGAQQMMKRTQEVQDFEILELKSSESLSVNLAIAGWVSEKEDCTNFWDGWKTDPCSGDLFSLQWEVQCQRELTNAVMDMIKSKIYGKVKSEIIKRTVLATLMSSLWPLALLQYGVLIDNPFHNACDRAEKTGQVLADFLMTKPFGERPVSLTGQSLGARVIWFCLKELALKKQFHLIENVIMMGAPVTPSVEEWRIASTVVNGRFVNVYSTNDWILGFLYRAANIRIFNRIAGLQPARPTDTASEPLKVEDVDASDLVSGHNDYKKKLMLILERTGAAKIANNKTDA